MTQRSPKRSLYPQLTPTLSCRVSLGCLAISERSDEVFGFLLWWRQLVRWTSARSLQIVISSLTADFLRHSGIVLLCDTDLSHQFQLSVLPLQHYSYKMRVKAVSIFYSLVRWLVVIKSEHKEVINIFFRDVFPQWLQGMAFVLREMKFSCSFIMGLHLFAQVFLHWCSTTRICPKRNAAWKSL